MAFTAAELLRYQLANIEELADDGNLFYVSLEGIPYRAAIADIVNKVVQDQNGVVTKQASITIPTAEVLTLGTTPVPFGITVDSNQYIIPISCAFFSEYVSATYATNTVLAIGATGASEYMFSLDVLGFTSDTFTQLPLVDGAPDETQYVLGADVQAVVNGAGDPTTGDSDITLTLIYALVTV